MSLSVTVPDPPKTLDDFHHMPYFAINLADLFPFRLEEIQGMAFVRLDERHLQTSVRHLYYISLV